MLACFAWSRLPRWSVHVLQCGRPAPSQLNWRAPKLDIQISGLATTMAVRRLALIKAPLGAISHQLAARCAPVVRARKRPTWKQLQQLPLAETIHRRLGFSWAHNNGPADVIINSWLRASAGRKLGFLFRSNPQQVGIPGARERAASAQGGAAEASKREANTYACSRCTL